MKKIINKIKKNDLMNSKNTGKFKEVILKIQKILVVNLKKKINLKMKNH